MPISRAHAATGACFSEEALSALVDLVVRYNIHLVSDEVYALSVFRDISGRPNFTSVLSLNLEKKGAIELVHVLYGFSKVELPAPVVIQTSDESLL
jgi:aspartate/methionine/tyrosine aminotransferase